MKNKTLFAFAMIAFASCTVVRPPSTVQKNDAESIPKTINRQSVESVEGLLTMHPISVILESKKKFYSFLAPNAQTIFITEEESAFKDINEYLPVKLNPDRLVVLVGPTINPYTYFTKDQFDDLNSEYAKVGIQLNNWKVARLFNYATTTWSEYKKLKDNREGKITQSAPVVEESSQTKETLNTQSNDESNTRKSKKREEQKKGTIKFDDKNNEKMKKS